VLYPGAGYSSGMASIELDDLAQAIFDTTQYESEGAEVRAMYQFAVEIASTAELVTLSEHDAFRFLVLAISGKRV
jgi:hypothetical protein